MMKKILIIALIIGLVGIGFITVFRDPSLVSYIEEIEIEVGDKTYHLLKYDFGAYLQDIKNVITQPTELTIDPNPLTWIDPGSNWTTSQFWEAILNNLKYIVNFWITFLNIILYPVRISCYVGKVVLMILGLNINENNTLYWIYDFIRGFLLSQIPYLT